MSVEQNKTNLKRTVEAFNKGNMEIVPELFSEEWVYKSSLGVEFKGVDGSRKFGAMYRNAFPDLLTTIDEMIGEGDRLASIQTLTGTFTGNLGNIEPTEQKVNIKIAYFYRFENGKQVEVIPFMDRLLFYQQLGFTPPYAQ